MNKKYSTLFLCAAFAMSAQAAEETAKADVLGRHISNMRNTPKAYVKDVKKQVSQKVALKGEKGSVPKSLMKAYPAGETQVNNPSQGSFEYWGYSNNNGGVTMAKKYTLNGTQYNNESDYVAQAKSLEDSDYPRLVYKINHTVNYGNTVNENLYGVYKTTSSCSGQDSCVVNEVVDATFRDTHGYLAPQYDLIHYWKYTFVSINSKLYNDFIRPGNPGKDIGIAVNENGLPLNATMKVVPADQYQVAANCHDATPAQVVASSKAVRTINSVASKSKIYVYDRWCDNTSGSSLALPADGYDKNPKIYVGNLGFSVSNDYYPNYGAASEYVDNFIYNTRTIEIAAAGNAGFRSHSSIAPAAKALNAITVGAVHNNMTYHYTSSATNPVLSESGYTVAKPEIANYSDFLYPSAGVGAIVKGNQNDVLTPYAMQTGSAAAYTTASVALLLKKYPFYKWHPEVVKALLLTSSLDQITDAASHDPDNMNVSGIPVPVAAAVPNGKAMSVYNRSRYWNGNNGNFFDSSDEIVFFEENIKSNHRYRSAISWLVNGTYVLENGYLPFDLDLKVYEAPANSNSWSFVSQSISTPNAFEVVDFTTKSNTGRLKIVIKRYNNRGGRVHLGYNLHEVHPELM
ncbi:MAG: hypothetical protein II565_13445 [Fibrobacter sp.]|nr:hypothetical protein [Fibrobacter sp.]